MKKMRWMFIGLVVIFGLSTPGMAAEETPCVAADKIEQSIAPEAELVQLSCFTDKYEGGDAIHFKVVIKNVSDKPQRYRVNIFLDNDKAIGGLLPVKTKDGLVQPGATIDFAYPVKGMVEKPQSLILRITTTES